MSIRSALAQSVPVEVLVLDDGSTDGTPEMVAKEFPQVRYYRYEGPNGPSFLRNRGSEMASCPILFPIDDDSIFQSKHTVEQTLAEFDHPRVAAVGIPFVNVCQSSQLLQAAPDRRHMYVGLAYVGAAHAIRRDLFLGAGGYREQFFYMGEEGDVCLRLLERGYVVRMGSADPIHHMESPARTQWRADHHGRRNDVLYAWYNVPWPSLAIHLAATTFNGLVFGIKVRRPLRMIRGLASGYRAILKDWGLRRPVNPQTYRIVRLLKRRGTVPFSQIDSLLPPMIPPAGPAPVSRPRRAEAGKVNQPILM